MRNIPVLIVLLLVSPGVVHGQSLELVGSAGPTITDTGHSLAAGVGFSLSAGATSSPRPAPRWTMVFAFERTYLATSTTRDGDVISSFRGGTLFLGTAEVRFAPFGRGRIGPFGLAGIADGVSRPNVNEIFPNRATRHVQAMFVGGGVAVPVGDRISVFADGRMMFGAEGPEGVVAVAPIRAGAAWRF